MLMSNKDKRSILPQLRFPEFHNSPAWNIKHLGELLSIGNGRDYKHLTKGSIPVYGTGGYMLSVDDYLYDGESVCIGRKGTIDKPIYLTGKFWTVDTLFYTHSFKKCLPKFVYLLFQNISWLNYNAASGVPSLSKNTIEKIEVAIPALEEQQKIADCLSSIDELITAESKKLYAFKAHKKGLIQQLFPAKDESLPKLRFPYFHHAGNWKIKLLGNLIKYKNGIAHEQHISDIGKYIVVNSKFISTEGVVRKFTNDGFCIAKKGNILMVLSDVPNGKAIAKCFLVDRDELYTVNQRICIINPEENISEFIYYTIDRNPFYLNFDDGIKQTNLRKDDVLACPIFVPPSENEQQKIAEVIASVDNLIISQSKKLDVLKNHKKGLMQQLFPNISEL